MVVVVDVDGSRVTVVEVVTVSLFGTVNVVDSVYSTVLVVVLTVEAVVEITVVEHGAEV